MSDFYDMETMSGKQSQAMEDRLLSRFYTSGSAKDSGIAVVKGYENRIVSTASIANNSGTNFVLGVRSNFNFAILVTMECNVYIDNLDDIDYQLPGGSAINESQWRMNGPINTPYNSSAVAFKAASSFRSRVQIRNLSGSTHTVYVVRKVRYIADRGDYVLE